VGETNIEKN